MPDLDTKNFKVSIRDVVFILGLACMVLSNYYIVKGSIRDNQLEQKAINDVNNLKLQTLGLQVDKLEVEIDALRNKPLIK